MPVTYKKYPEDVVEDTGTVGILLPMNNTTARNGLFATSRTTEQQAISNYVNLLLTFKGERVMQPEFGIGLPNYLFEPNTEAIRSEIEFAIRTQSAFWLPYITNHKIEVLERADIPGIGDNAENSIRVIITFSVGRDLANKQITIFSEGGRTNVQIG